MKPQRILLASTNPGKLRELRELLAGLPVEVLAPEEAAFELPEAEETGETFLENAVNKAFAASEAAAAAGEDDLWALADDSGLVVDALDGAPGVYSARFAGAEGPREERDRANVAALLERLKGLAEEQRAARFACVVAVTRGDELLFAVEGVSEGRIALEPEGSGGFGYDPVFYHLESGATFAQLDDTAKNAVSHRGMAMRRLREVLDTVLPKA